MKIPSTQTVKTLFPRASDPAAISAAIALVVEKYNINTQKRLASFLAQVAHESAGLSVFNENLNYSSDALSRLFGKYFDDKAAKAYGRRPEAIANRVYGSRMGNGPEASGDGFRYRGRGAIQLTGKDNYRAASASCGFDYVGSPELVATMPHAVLTAGWFWDSRSLNALADVGDQKGICKKVNGGYHGLEERIALYNKILPAVA